MLAISGREFMCAAKPIVYFSLKYKNLENGGVAIAALLMSPFSAPPLFRDSPKVKVKPPVRRI